VRREDIRALLRDLVRAARFPDPRTAEAHGLLAWGGDLSAERLLAAYACGIFPWFEEPPVLWFSPDPRLVLLPHELHLSRSLRRSVERGRYEVRFDTRCGDVIRACASTPRPGQRGTWLTPDMIEAYDRLHALGFVHSAEAFEQGELVGGCYGLSLGRAFFGESMFAHRSDASKVAFAHLVRRLEGWGFDFVDCQVPTAHLMRLGARECSRERFLRALARALDAPTLRGPWTGGRECADATR